jgi:hypothetical protein
MGLNGERLVETTSLALVGRENSICWPAGGGPAPGAFETDSAPKPRAAKARHQFQLQNLELIVTRNSTQILPTVKLKK